MTVFHSGVALSALFSVFQSFILQDFIRNKREIDLMYNLLNCEVVLYRIDRCIDSFRKRRRYKEGQYR